MNDPIFEYRQRYERFLSRIANMLEEHVSGYMSNLDHIDRVTARAKHPDRFAEKAQRTDENGRRRYGAPLTEIQDQLGVRIVVFYKNDVNVVVDVIRRYFQPIEKRELVPDSQWSFGYFGLHFVLPTPRDAVPEDVPLEEVPQFFELQIKTLFQHAWSEANHDLGYKSHVQLEPDRQRLLAYSAAQAWGADHVFEELRVQLLGATEPRPEYRTANTWPTD